MTTPVVEGEARLNITATNATLGSGKLLGIFVSQASNTPTIKVADGRMKENQ